MLVAHGNHGRENIVPSAGLGHYVVGEHATIPANMPEGFAECAIITSEPETGMVGDGELAVRVIRQTMMTGFIVRACAFDGGVILRDVKINGPGTKRISEYFEGLIQLLWLGPIPVGGQQSVFRGVIAENIEEGMSHICLESKGAWTIHAFEQIHHLSPAMHSAPADFALRSQAFAKPFGNVAGLGKGLGNALLIAVRVLRPI